jgi:hypothetical protein
VLTDWQDAIKLQASEDEKKPQLSPSALLTGCIGKDMKHQGSLYATIFEAKLLTNGSEPRKFPMLVEAYKVLGIPFLKGAYKADGGGVAVDKLHKKAESTGGSGAVKPKERNTTAKHVKPSWAAGIDVSGGLVGGIDAAVQKAKEILRLDAQVKKANQKLTKAVAAATVGEGRADKETIRAVASGGGGADAVEQSGGKATASGTKPLKAVRPSAGGGKAAAGGGGAAAAGKDVILHPTKRRTPEERQ